MMSRWGNWIAAALVALPLTLGIGLRCTGLQDQGLWGDELFSAGLILYRPLIPPTGTPWLERRDIGHLGETESFWSAKATDQSPPLFELVGKGVTALAGSSETALRMPSVLAGVVFLLWVAMRAWRYRRDATGMAYLCLLSMVAISGPLVWYAKEARVYSLAVTLCGVLIVKFWERWQQGWRTAPLPGWGEAWLFAAVAWAHYSALALAGLMWLAYAWEVLRRREGYAGVRLAVMPLVLLVWLGLSWYGFRETIRGGAGWIPPSSYGTVLWNLIFDSMSHDLIQLHGWPGWIWLLVLIAAGLFWTKMRAGQNLEPAGESAMVAGLLRASAAVLLLCAFFLPLVAGIVTASRIFHWRHLLFMLPALYLGIGGVLALIRLRWRWLAWSLLALLLVGQYPLLQRNLAEKKVDLRTAEKFVLARLQTGDTILATNLVDEIAARYYSPEALPGKPVPNADRYRFIFLNSADTPELCRKMSGMARFGVMVHAFAADEVNALRQDCGADYDIESIATFEYLGQVWRRKPSASAAPVSSTEPKS